jgi:hypothetical protein
MRFLAVVRFLSLLNLLLAGAQYLTFVFFLQGLARSFQARDLAERCQQLIGLSALLLLLDVLMLLFSGLMWALAGLLALFTLMGILGWIVLLLGLVQRVWYLKILHGVRRLVPARGRRRGKRQPG